MSINIKNKNINLKKNYLYLQMENDYLENEKNLIKDINQKNKSKIISQEETKIINQKINEAKTILEERALKQRNELHKLWHSRSTILQKLKSPLIKEKFKFESEDIKLENENKNNIRDLVKNKKEYIKNHIKLPPISEILKREIEKRLNKNINNGKKFIFNNHNNSNISLSNEKKDNTKKLKKKTNISRNHKLYSISIQTDKRSNILNLKSIIKPPNNFNYLEEIKQKRLLRNSDIKNNSLSEDKYNMTNKDINLNFKKLEIEAMESKYKRNKQLLKLQGGYLNNKDLSDNMNELLIDSIKRKLTIIENN